MDSEKLKEIRDNLYLLPVLRDKSEKLNIKLKEANKKVSELLQKYEKERLDAEQLKNNTLSAFILKLVGKYEGRLEKEEREALTAKIEYDQAVVRVEELSLELEDTRKRISDLEREKQKYDNEIKEREKKILSGMSSEKSEEYMRLIEEENSSGRQMVEMDEAIRAANRVQSTIQTVIRHLESADKWATYDIWTRGGIISHMAKYNHIDQAESDFHRVSSQLRELKRELSDINNFAVPGMDGIDSATRAFDFWFDNIFTDFKVRNRIRGDIDQMWKLTKNIDKIIARIESGRSEIKRRRESIEQRKNDLLISL